MVFVIPFLYGLVGYVDDIRKLVFSLPLKDLQDVCKKYEERVPEPMNTQFTEKVNKDEAIRNKGSRRRAWSKLFPPGKQ